jgi:hypothetical protein
MSPIILALAAAGQPLEPTVDATCPNAAVQRVGPDAGAQMQRLDRLPPSETYLAVLHRENGCTRPILARDYRQGSVRPR